jgi:tryptophan synthase beta subunit
MTDMPGYSEEFGGAYVPEVLVGTFAELERAYLAARADPAFFREYEQLMRSYSCRPTPLTFAENLTRELGGARIYVKREDLNHTGAHKANNVMGQGLLVRRMGKRRVIAETGAGQHGVATATMAAKFGLECTIYMGEEDVLRQRPNVFWMERLGARVVTVTAGSRTLKDAVNEAFRDWIGSMDHTHYVLGTACGPHPFPEMVAWFQSIVGTEAREQVLAATGRLPRRVYACVGGGSNALGLFSGFMDDPAVELVGVRRIDRGRPGLPQLLPAGRRRADEDHAQRGGRARLRRGVAAARSAEAHGSCALRVGDRPRGARRDGPHHPARGADPGARVVARLCAGVEGSRQPEPRRRGADQPIRARRQGHLHGRGRL